MKLSRVIWKMGCIGLVACTFSSVLGNEPREPSSDTEIKTIVRKTEGAPSETEVFIEASADDSVGPVSRKDWPYLGIATAEASDTLSAQLGIRSGTGLVVTYVATESPAAKAGLQKHDVLARLGEQWLVHPAQLRKLIRSYKQGEQLSLTFYRGGKEQSVSVTLGSMPAESQKPADLREVEDSLDKSDESPEEQHIDRALHESLKHLNNDRHAIHKEVHRSMEEVREVIKQAFRDVTDVASTLDPVQRIIKEIKQSGVKVDKNATVVVRSAGKGVKSVVKADDSGTIVLVQNPKMRLTAHDKEGHLLFDGEVETPEQRNQVSPELWNRVEPLLSKMSEEPKAE